MKKKLTDKEWAHNAMKFLASTTDDDILKVQAEHGNTYAAKELLKRNRMAKLNKLFR